MTPTQPQGRQKHPSPCGTLQDVALGGLSKRGSKKPLQTWKVDSDCGHSPVYVYHQVYATGIGVNHPDLDPQGKNKHPGYWPTGHALEGCGGHNRYPPPGIIQFHDVFHGFQVERGTETATMELKLDQELTSVKQYPLLPSLPQPEKVLQHSRPGTHHKDIGRLRCGAKYVKSLCNLLSPPRGRQKTEWLPWPEI